MLYVLFFKSFCSSFKQTVLFSIINGQFSKVNLPPGQFTSRSVGPGQHVRGQLRPVNCRGIGLPYFLAFESDDPKVIG